MNDLDKPTAAQNLFFQAPEIRFHVAAQKAVETFSTPLESWFLFRDGSAFRFAKDEPDDVAVWEARYLKAATKAVLAYEVALKGYEAALKEIAALQHIPAAIEGVLQEMDAVWGGDRVSSKWITDALRAALKGAS